MFETGEVPLPPHRRCGVWLLALQPEDGPDGGTCTRDPQLCKRVPWLLGYVVKKLPRLRSLDVGRLLRSAVLNDRGLSVFGEAGGSCTRTVRIKSPLC